MGATPETSRPPSPDERQGGSNFDRDVEGTHEGVGPDGSRLAAALRYASLGWYVHPLRPGRKEPLTEHGCLDASHWQHNIKAWWARWPDANVGIALEPSGLAVLDIDPRNGGSLAELHQAVDLGEPLVQHTGGGGTHLIYSDRGVALRSSLGYAGLDGIDVKRNGYIVAAPSVTTGPYAWADDVIDVGPGVVRLDLGVAPIMPSMVLDLCRAPERERCITFGSYRVHDSLDDRERAYIDAALNDACQRLASTAVGYRHSAVYYTARSLGEYVGGGVLARARAPARITQAAEQLYGETLNTVEEKTIEQGLAKGEREPRGIPDEHSATRRLLVRIALAEHPLDIVELYAENNPELIRMFGYCDDELELATKNVFAVGGGDALARSARIVIES